LEATTSTRGGCTERADLLFSLRDVWRYTITIKHRDQHLSSLGVAAHKYVITVATEQRIGVATRPTDTGREGYLWPDNISTP
jgi:hypothetical protein